MVEGTLLYTARILSISVTEPRPTTIGNVLSKKIKIDKLVKLIFDVDEYGIYEYFSLSVL